MSKKILVLLLSLFVLALVASGFWWWNSQAGVRALNKTLPEGVRVAKSLFGEEYWVVNKIDGYEFRVPMAWGGIEKIEYTPRLEELGYVVGSIDLKGNQGGSTIVTINRFIVEKDNIDLKDWIRNFFQTFDLSGDLLEDIVGKFDVVKTLENEHLLGMHAFFFRKDKVVYRIINGSEEFIKEIILNGQW